jgi:1-deoxy-D-xylulose-5-phosphate synthase
MLRFALGHVGVVALRWPKAPFKLAPLPGNDVPLALGKAVTLREGSSIALVAYGAMVEASLNAADILAEIGIEATVINARFVKPLDADAMVAAASSHPLLVTVEDHTLQAGFGSTVVEALADRGVTGTRIVRLGLPDRFIEHGGRGELLDRYGLSAARIAERCRRELVDAKI